MEHTKGKWIVDADSAGILVVSDPPGMSIEVTIPGRKPTATDHANARLIAASPDLLIALQALIKACNPEPGRGVCVMDDDQPIVAARAAIAKAEGK